MKVPEKLIEALVVGELSSKEEGEIMDLIKNDPELEKLWIEYKELWEYAKFKTLVDKRKNELKQIEPTKNPEIREEYLAAIDKLQKGPIFQPIVLSRKK